MHSRALTLVDVYPALLFAPSLFLLFFIPLHLKSIHLFILPPTEQHQLSRSCRFHRDGSHTRLDAARTCMWRCCDDASSCCLVVPSNPPTSHLPQKGRSEDAASHRRAPLCTPSPHARQISGYETVSEERFLGGGREEAGAAVKSAVAAVNQQINSQTDQLRPQYLHANGRTCLLPVPGILESNWERRGNHCSQAAFVLSICPCSKKQTNSRTHLHIQGYQASSSWLIIFFFPSLPAPLTLSFLSSLSFVNQGHPKPLPPLLYGPPQRCRGSSCEF